jgi:putative ATP-binding cassette transporter
LDTLISGEGMLTTEAHGYLERLDIAHKVSVRDGAFTTSDLSTGLRKWLTLVQAYLDTPPGDVARRMGRQSGPELPLDFLWRDSAGPEASGQNADRDSPDDRHFSAADRYIRLEDGRIVEEVRPVRVSSRPIAPPSQTTPDRCDTDPGTSVSSPSLSADR